MKLNFVYLIFWVLSIRFTFSFFAELTMADEESFSDAQTVEISEGDHEGNYNKISALDEKIEQLEQDKLELAKENEFVAETIKKYKEQIEQLETDKAKMKSEIDQAESDKKTLESIAARAAQLETELSRAQHDLITSQTEGQEANNELMEVNRIVSELRKSDSEKSAKLGVLEKERNLLLERINKDDEGVKASKAESESRIRELKTKIEALEMRDSSYKSEKVKVEEEMKVRVEEKEDQIRHLTKLVDEFQSVISRNRAEMEKSNKEREELEIVKNELEALLKKSERKVKELELKLSQLHKELEGSEKVISGLKEKAIEAVNGNDLGLDRSIDGEEEKGLKIEWPLVAASAGAVAVFAVVYLRYIRQR